MAPTPPVPIPASLARPRSRFVCRECQAQQPRWLGRCPSCEAWESLVEETQSGDATPDLLRVEPAPGTTRTPEPPSHDRAGAGRARPTPRPPAAPRRPKDELLLEALARWSRDNPHLLGERYRRASDLLEQLPQGRIARGARRLRQEAEAALRQTLSDVDVTIRYKNPDYAADDDDEDEDEDEDEVDDD